MSNFFAEDVGTQDKSNAFADTVAATPVDDQEMDVIHKTNNPNMETPSSFGLVEISKDIVAALNPGAAAGAYSADTKFAKGLASTFASTPQIAGTSLVEAGELSQAMKDKSLLDSASGAFMRNFSLGPTSAMAAASKDAFLNAVSDTAIPQVMQNAGNALVSKNQKWLDSMGLSPKGGTSVAFDAGAGLGQMFITVGSTFLTKNPAIATAYMTALINTGDYQEARKAGKEPQEAASIAATSAIGQGLIEGLGGKVFLAAAAGSSFMRKVLTRAMGQAAEETGQGVVEETVKGVTGVRDTPMSEKLLNIGYQGMLGFIIGAPVSAIVTRIEDAGKQQGLPPEKIKEISDNLIANQDQIVDAATVLIDKETAGVTNDEPARAETLKAVNQVIAQQQEIEKATADGSTESPMIAAEMLMRSANVSDEVKANIRGLDSNFTMEQLREVASGQASVTAPIDGDYFRQAGDIKTQLQQEGDISKPSVLHKVLGYKPESLTAFIKRKGGIVDPGGELKARDINHRSLPGLVRKTKGDQSTREIMGGVQENTVSGIDAVKERVFDAGYFPEKTDYNQISDSELYDAIADDVQGNKRYTDDDQQKINEYRDSAQGDQYAAMGITHEMDQEAIAEILRANAETKQVTTDKNDPRFSGELDAAETKANEKNITADYKAIREMEPEKSRNGEGAGDWLNDAFTPVSTRLGKIHESLKHAVRRFTFNTGLYTHEDKVGIKNYLEKASEMEVGDYREFDLALKNRDAEKVDELIKKYDMQEEWKALREVLDGIHDRAQEVGFDLGYVQDYFPREVKPMMAPEFLSTMRGLPQWGEIQLALNEVDPNGTLTPAERAEFINKFLRGFVSDKINLARPGFTKERTVDYVKPEWNRFYEDSSQALIHYVSAMNKGIESRRLFGKSDKDTDKNIGVYVDSLIEQGTISAEQEGELREILKGIMEQKGTRGIVSWAKDSGYIFTMGSPISALTQLKDLQFSLYKNGYYNTFSSFAKSLAGKGIATPTDLGLENIIQEFGDNTKSANAVRAVFKASGLTFMDGIGKKTFIDGAYKRLKKENAKGKLDDKLDLIFGEEAGQVKKDLESGTLSENLKYLLFSELSDFQPISLAEQPLSYLRAGNGRIFYMLKSYTIRQFDIYRREAFSKIASGNLKETTEGFQNLFKLGISMMLMGLPVDALKNWILGRDFDINDLAMENILQIMGFSKYQVYKSKTEGIMRTLLTTLFIPAIGPAVLIDDLQKDSMKVASGKRAVEDSDVLQRVPVVGKFYYWWWGGGATKEGKKNKSITGGKKKGATRD